MKGLIPVIGSIVLILSLGAFCLTVYGQMLCGDGFSGGMPDGRIYSAEEPPYPYLPTVLPKEPILPPIPPIEPLG